MHHSGASRGENAEVCAIITDVTLHTATASGSSSLAHLWGGWPSEGRSGGGQSKRAILRPHPGLRFALADPPY
jgi:hypothetical protein